MKISYNIFSNNFACDIFLEHDICHNTSFFEKLLIPHISRYAIITDDHVASLYGHTLSFSLQQAGLKVSLFSFPPGELYKTRATKQILEDELFKQGFGKDSCIVALGGGVVTDIAGYVAATYCRGVPLILIPTSLMGMVDACIGGKNGVNLSCGKNLIGTIYHPKKIIIDTSFLKTLPKQEFLYGCAEMLKHGMIYDTSYFSFLETSADKILGQDPIFLKHAIFQSCLIKKTIIEHDVREQGQRHLLNFGHTIAHALEKLSQYTLAHGRAVAIGLLIESHLSMQQGILPKASFHRIYNILINYHLPLTLPYRYNVNELWSAMMLDKKSLNGTPSFVIIEDIGTALSCDGIYLKQFEKPAVKTSLEWMNDALCCDSRTYC